MNRVLAETLALLNGLIAVAIFVSGLVAGYRMSGGALIGTLSGGFLGFVIAALACGTIAYLALIERHLAKLVGSSIRDDVAEETAARRRDPILTDDWNDYK